MIAKTTWLISWALVLGCIHNASALTLPTPGYEPAWDPADWPRLGYVLSAMNASESGTILVGGWGESSPGFVTALDVDGRQQWTKSISASAVNDIHIDSTGNIYVAGEATPYGSAAVVAKLTPQGQPLWQRQVSITDYQYGEQVAVDSMGNVYLAGIASGLGLNPFVSKYDLNGALQWTKTYDYDIGPVAVGLSINADDDLLYAGRGAYTGARLSKFTPDGDVVWNHFTEYSAIARRESQPTALATDASGNSYIVGSTDIRFGPNNAVIESDAFLAKHDSEGNLIWQQRIAGLPAGQATAVTLGQNGNVFIAGITDDTPAGEVQNLVDGFLAEFSPTGKQVWYQQFGSEYSDFPRDILVDADRRIFVAGFQKDYLGPQYDNAGFIARFDPTPVPEPASAAMLCCLASCAVAMHLRQGRQ